MYCKAYLVYGKIILALSRTTNLADIINFITFGDRQWLDRY